MRKSKPVITLLSIQLVLAVALALVNPVNDYIIRTKGTEYTFAVHESWLTGDFVNYVEANCYLDFGFDFDRFDYHSEPYAVISTDKNGLSYISELSETPPENGDWVGTEEEPFDYVCYYSSDKIDYELIENTDLFDSNSFDFSDKYEITVRVSVYKGKTVLNAFLVNGVEIGEFLKNI